MTNSTRGVRPMRRLAVATILPLAAACTRIAPIDVDGLVVGQTGRPAAGIAVTVRGQGSMVTGDDGRFVFRDVAPPYDLVHTTEYGFTEEYRGVTRADPRVRTHVDVSYCDVIDVNGAIAREDGGVVAPETRVGVTGPPGRETTPYLGVYEVVTWAPCDSSTAEVWALSPDPAHGQWFFGSADIDLHPDADPQAPDDYTRDLVLEATGAANIRVVPRDVPEGFEALLGTWDLDVSPSIHVAGFALDASGEQSVPALPGAPIAVTMWANGPPDANGNHAAVWSMRRSISPGETVELDFMEPPRIESSETELAWSEASEPSVYRLLIGHAYVLHTAERSIRLADLPAGGVGSSWSVETVGRRRSVDELLGDPLEETIGGHSTPGTIGVPSQEI